MGIKRIRLKIVLLLVPFFVAIVASTTHHRLRHARPIPEVIVSKAAELDSRDKFGSSMDTHDQGYAECSESFCPGKILRMKRQSNDTNVAQDDSKNSTSSGGAAAVAAATSGEDSDSAPLPPPVQVSLDMPKNYPFPSLDVVQHQPVPTRPRRPLGIQSAYPVVHIPSPSIGMPSTLEISNQDPVSLLSEGQAPSLGAPVEPPMEESMRPTDSVRLPKLSESPEVLDLSEFNVPGSNDPVVMPPAENVGSSSGDVPTVADIQTPHVQAPQITNPLPPAPDVANLLPSRQRTRVMGAQDWRFSEQPKRQCKSKQTCRADYGSMAGPPMAGTPIIGPPMAGPPMGQPPMAPPPAAQPPIAQPPTGCRALPGQTIVPIQSTAVVGPDPWKVAEQEAFVEIVNRDDPPATDGEPADSAGERNGLAFLALVVANGLYLLL